LGRTQPASVEKCSRHSSTDINRKHAISRTSGRFDSQGNSALGYRPWLHLFAIAIDLPEQLDYPQMHAIASGVALYAANNLPDKTPLVLVIERDYAQVFGQTIKALRPQLPLVSIDQVGLGEGDFIDIGEPILGGRVVPLSVKTLIFLPLIKLGRSAFGGNRIHHTGGSICS
jgi:hypothetical protein